MGEIQLKKCEGRELTKDQLAGAGADGGLAGEPVRGAQPPAAGVPGPDRHGLLSRVCAQRSQLLHLRFLTSIAQPSISQSAKLLPGAISGGALTSMPAALLSSQSAALEGKAIDMPFSPFAPFQSQSSVIPPD